MPVARDVNGNVLPAVRPTGATYDLVGTMSGVFGQNTRLIRVAGVTDVRLAIGLTPVANATSVLVPLGAIDYFPVMPGEKVAVLGTANIAECG